MNQGTTISTRLIKINREEDPVKRLQMRVAELPLHYLSTTETRRDIERVLGRVLQLQTACENVTAELQRVRQELAVTERKLSWLSELHSEIEAGGTYGEGE